MTRAWAWILVAVGALALTGRAQGAALPSLSADEIVRQLAERERERTQELTSYSSIRVYRLQYRGFPGQREAEMVVRSDYQAPDRKHLTVLSQSGSTFLIDKVLKHLLWSEEECAQEDNCARTALTVQNYRFELLGQEVVNGRPNYVLRATPRADQKYLYRGRVWVDGNDFALTRIDAEPAKRPSFWLERIKIQHTYTKVGDFWLPSENDSTSEVRLGGVAQLTISYRDYSISQRQTGAPQQAQSELPAPPPELW
jgi:hypothetical protein